jgi:hypothetical protein
MLYLLPIIIFTFLDKEKNMSAKKEKSNKVGTDLALPFMCQHIEIH